MSVQEFTYKFLNDQAMGIAISTDGPSADKKEVLTHWSIPGK